MTPEEVVSLNRKIFDRFKPEGVQWLNDEFVTIAGLNWSPAESLDDAVACRPHGTHIDLIIDDQGASCKATTRHGSDAYPADTPAAALCLALLAMEESK